METNKFKLRWGIHRGTIWSRDHGDTLLFNTEEDAVEWLRINKLHYKAMGYEIWFAVLVYPDGTEKKLDSNYNYR